MNTRVLGILCIAGSLIYLVAGFWGLVSGALESGEAIPNLRLAIPELLLWIGAVAGLVGLIQGDAVGSNPVVRAVAFLPIIALASGIVGGIALLFGALTWDSILFTVFYFGLLAGLVLVSILTIAAKTWPGWRRFVPLFVLVMYFFIRIVVAGDPSPFPTNIGYFLGAVVGFASWALLGYVVATAEPAPARARSATA